MRACVARRVTYNSCPISIKLSNFINDLQYIVHTNYKSFGLVISEKFFFLFSINQKQEFVVLLCDQHEMN